MTFRSHPAPVGRQLENLSMSPLRSASIGLGKVNKPLKNKDFIYANLNSIKNLFTSESCIDSRIYGERLRSFIQITDYWRQR